jgi:hypothetical protein
MSGKRDGGGAVPTRAVVLSVLILTCLVPSRIAAPNTVRAAALGAMHCATSVPTPSNTSLPEVRGVTTRGKLWALLFYRPPAAAGTTEKIVVRITGKGPIHLVGIGPAGQTIQPAWGPERHGGSNWNRPGGEWGTGWRFPAVGCWHIHAKRSGASGNVWLEVAGS